MPNDASGDSNPLSLQKLSDSESSFSDFEWWLIQFANLNGWSGRGVIRIGNHKEVVQDWLEGEDDEY